jgi:hypothetical protein
MSRTRPAACLCLALCLLAFPGRAEETYSFNPDEFEKKRFTWGGYVEAKGEHFEFNEDGALAILNQYREPRAELNRFTAALQLDGRFQQGITTLNWLLKGWAAQDEVAWADDIDLYTGYASIKASPRLTLDLGKKTFKWGKGYAWNPVAFIDRPKNPDDPEEALEGFIGAGADLVRSMDGPLRTLALTGVALPVWQGVNEDFGAADNVNVAAKLYLLLRDTDIDFLLYTGNSRSTRFGFDFSRNLAPNFEIHGELAHTPAQQQMYLAESGILTAREVSDTSGLIGMRYLTEREVTAIVEYYHNGDDYTEEELSRFYQVVAKGYEQYLAGGGDTLLHRAANSSQSGYGRPQVGRNYFYARLTAKEPRNILYFTPAITAIVQLDDQSYSLTPELIYTGFTNFELRARFTWLQGSDETEYGEKPNESRAELRLRWYF